MTVNLEEAVKQLTDFLKTEAKTETVVGQSFQLGEFTCMPVIKFGDLFQRSRFIFIILCEKIKYQTKMVARAARTINDFLLGHFLFSGTAVGK